MRIVIDLDGTICEIKSPNQLYEDVKPLPGAAEKIAQMRSQGHYIIIQTARNMATCESNLGKVMKNIGRVTLEWLEKYRIEYDEIYFGKPNGHVYIDDRALRYESWNEVTPDSLKKASGER
jgi:capsule biosynthesis phosphatase